MVPSQLDIRRIKGKRAGLDFHVRDVVSPGRKPSLLVMMCHGFNASGLEMVSLAEGILSRFPALAPDVRFVFPDAPLYLDGPFSEARAWWHQATGAASSASPSADPTENQPPGGRSRAREQVMALLDEVTREMEIPMSRVLIGGFAQGASLGLDVALNLLEAPAALCLLSSGHMAAEWRRQAPARAGLPVLQCHGLMDEVEAFDGATRLGEMLDDSGLRVEFFPFSDAHCITPPVIERLGHLVTRCLETALAGSDAVEAVRPLETAGARSGLRASAVSRPAVADVPDAIARALAASLPVGPA